MDRLKRFCDLFRFREDIRLQSSKLACQRSRRLRGHGFLALGKVRLKIIFLNYCYWVHKHTHILFSPDCLFKVCEKPSKFAVGVRVVIVVSAYCPRTQVQHRHTFFANILAKTKDLAKPLIKWSKISWLFFAFSEFTLNSSWVVTGHSLLPVIRVQYRFYFYFNWPRNGVTFYWTFWNFAF